jgi:hypothetical protein
MGAGSPPSFIFDPHGSPPGWSEIALATGIAFIAAGSGMEELGSALFVAASSAVGAPH